MRVTHLPRATNVFKLTPLHGLARSVLLSKLSQLKEGSLKVEDEHGNRLEFGDPRAPIELTAHVRILHSRAYSRMALGGSVGAGESYIDGDWECDHLTALVRVFVRNREVLTDVDGGLGRLIQPALRAMHLRRKNHEHQARKNIQAHYDLGNDFFSLFLDESRMYSSGIFLSPETTLAEAQTEKNDRLCRRLDLRPEHHLVEIGTGWGGFAEHAATRYGCKITTTTISQEQYRWVEARIRELGLQDRVQLLFEDYRNLKGKYDRLVSIEMIEAVGDSYLETYFRACSSLLKPEGKMAIQSILIRDRFHAEALRSVDFIQTHVFPGSNIPSVARILSAASSGTDLALTHFEEFGQDYARTLRAWWQNLSRQARKIEELGYPASLLRLWRFYLAYCEGGFLEGQITVGHLVFEKPRALQASDTRGEP